MKYLKISFLAIAVVCSSFMQSTAQTADEIIQKHITAIGGLDNWKKVKTIKISGSVSAQGTEIPITVYKSHNKGFKAEFTVNGMTGYSIVTEKAGWSYNPFMGQTKAEAMTADDVKEEQQQLDATSPLIDYKAKNIKVNFLGKDDVEGTECYKLKVTYPNGKDETMFIDASNYYHIKTITKVKANGKEMENAENFSNYKKLPEGIFFPMTIDMGMGAMDVKSVEINKGVDASTFVPKG